MKCPHCEDGHSAEYTALKNLWYGATEYKPEVPYTLEHPVVQKVIHNYYTKNPNARTFNGFPTERFIIAINRQMAHHLDEEDVKALISAGRLPSLTHYWDGERECKKPDDQMPTAKEVNEYAIQNTFGHDAINCYVVLTERLKKQGLSNKCTHCNGEGEIPDA